jgi:hypothetical protein
MIETSERLGEAVGGLLAPLAGVASYLRHARVFHPEGAVYRVEVTPLARTAPYDALAARLAGPALARLSTAWWKHGREWIDILGFALRFRDQPDPSPYPNEGDQDLLFATLRSPWTMLLAPLTTRQHDFLRNDYFALGTFEVAGVGRLAWRLVGPRARIAGRDRGERLEHAVATGAAAFRLEACPKTRRGRWLPVALVQLRERVVLDQEALSFSPFRTGRGIEPRGFLHALRVAPYRVSHWVRARQRGLRSSAAEASLHTSAPSS